jgi:IS4 transposase
VRKSEAAAEAARASVLRERARKGRTVDPRTLESAGYVFVLTSLTGDLLSASEVLELYRFRWQVELAFKRLKSLLHMDELPARDPPLARSFIYSKLLAALLLEDFTDRFLAFSPWGYRLA